MIVDTEKGEDVFGEGWNARNGVHEVSVPSRMNVYRALIDLIVLLSMAEGRLSRTTASSTSRTSRIAVYTGWRRAKNRKP